MLLWMDAFELFLRSFMGSEAETVLRFSAVGGARKYLLKKHGVEVMEQNSPEKKLAYTSFSAFSASLPASYRMASSSSLVSPPLPSSSPATQPASLQHGGAGVGKTARRSRRDGVDSRKRLMRDKTWEGSWDFVEMEGQQLDEGRRSRVPVGDIQNRHT